MLLSWALRPFARDCPLSLGEHVADSSFGLTGGVMYALLVGVGKVSGFTALNSARLDVDRLEKILLKNGYAVRSLPDSEGSWENFSQELRCLKGKAMNQDRILVYLNGHGLVESAARDKSRRGKLRVRGEDTVGFRFVMHGGKPGSPPEAVSIQEVLRLVDGEPRNHAQTILLLDACEGGRYFGRQTPFPPPYVSSLEAGSTYILGTWNKSIANRFYSPCMQEGLSGDADTSTYPSKGAQIKDGKVEAAELTAFVKDCVGRASLRLGIHIQEVTSFELVSKTLVLSRVRNK